MWYVAQTWYQPTSGGGKKGQRQGCDLLTKPRMVCVCDALVCDLWRTEFGTGLGIRMTCCILVVAAIPVEQLPLVLYFLI